MQYNGTRKLDRPIRENEDIERIVSRRKAMSVQRKQDSAERKTRVALEAIKGYKTVNEIASEYGGHPTQRANWKKQALDGLPEVFSPTRSDQKKREEDLIASLSQEIGHLKMQVDWLEKKSQAFR